MTIGLDLDFIRAQYPAPRWEAPFFENAGGAFVPKTVIKRMSSYMTEAQVQTGYPFATSAEASKRVEQGQSCVAELIGAEFDEIVLGASTSMNIYVLAQALRPLWKAGDEIVVSTANHESNSGPWRRLAEFGIKIVDWPVDPDTGALCIDRLQELLTSRTRLVAFPQVSNITGDINDVETITSLCHNAGAMVCVDGVAFAPHRAVDVKKWNVDFYLFSFYKVFGPHLGLMYCRRDRMLEAKGQYHYFFPEDDLAHKLNPAGPNHETIACLTGITDYLELAYKHHKLGNNSSLHSRMTTLFQLFAEHEQRLAERFLDFLLSESSVRLIGTSESSLAARVPTFSFQIKGVPSSQVAEKLGQASVYCGSGHFYAKRLLDSMNLDEPEVVRCSMAHYTSLQDVDRLVDELRRQLN
ncbi:MAG: aminotransferase class V-fold PLP-dependent enzyme [Pseudohongiellaceae bacterium]